MGAPGAISVNGSQGTLNFSLINNTLSNNHRGILIGGRPDLGAVVSGTVANNIVANSLLAGISLDTEFEPTVTNSYNLFFNNPYDWFTPGPGTLFVDPQFVGGGNYRLQLFSPAVNAASNGLVPSGISTDLDGNARIVCFADMGAYERTTVGDCSPPVVSPVPQPPSPPPSGMDR